MSHVHTPPCPSIAVRRGRKVEADAAHLVDRPRGTAPAYVVREVDAAAFRLDAPGATRFKFLDTHLEAIVILLETGPATAAQLQARLRDAGTEVPVSTVFRALAGLLEKGLVASSLTAQDEADDRAFLEKQQAWVASPAGTPPPKQMGARMPTSFTLTEEGLLFSKLGTMRTRLVDLIEPRNRSWLTKIFREVYKAASHRGCRDQVE